MSSTQAFADISERHIPLGKTGMETPEWNVWQRVGFRFAFCYLVLYNFVMIENLGLPGTGWIVKPYLAVSKPLAAWVAKYVFHITRNIIQTRGGSGDTTYDYMSLFCTAVFAVLGTIIWTLLDRNRKEYRQLHDWLRIYVRYALALTLLSYGMAKVIKTQFAFPGPSTLMQRYGDLSKMEVLWNFMGTSTVYTFFGGAVEVVAGLLLLFRRTTTLGAMVSATVMFNIAMMNFCYNVPVKLLSSSMVLMSIFLMIPDLHRLANILVLNRPTTATNLGATFRSGWMRIGGFAVKTLLIVFALFIFTKQNFEQSKQYGDNALKPPLYGAYDVEEFIQNGQIVPPLTTDANRWSNVIIDYPGSISVRMMNDSSRGYGSQVDPGKSTLTLSTFGKQKNQYVLDYSQPDPSHLVLQGTLGNDSLTIRLRKVDESKLRLNRTGFRWINEISNGQ